MANDFSALVPWLERIANTLEPAQRRALMRNIANRGKRSMGARIAAQRDPSGAAFVPRKRNHTRPNRRGAVFQRVARQIKTRYTADKAEVGFAGSTARVMKVHQFGLVAKFAPNQPPVPYAVRETVGWSNEDEAMITAEMQAFFDKL